MIADADKHALDQRGQAALGRACRARGSNWLFTRSTVSL